MRMVSIITGVVVMALFAVSCVWFSEGGDGGVAPVSQTGELSLRLNLSDAVSTRAVSTVTAKGESDTVEVLLIPSVSPAPETVTSILLDLETGLNEPVTVTLQAGWYRVLVLVGDKSGDTATLLATGSTPDLVEVVENEQSDVTITVSTISHDIAVPGPLVAGSTYTVDLAGDSGCDYITLDEGDTTAAYRGQYKLSGDSSYTVFTITATGSSWSAELILDAPTTSGEEVWSFAGPYVTYNDPATGCFRPAEDLAQLRWRWLSCTVLPDTSPLIGEVEIPVSFGAGATSLGVTVTWPD